MKFRGGKPPIGLLATARVLGVDHERLENDGKSRLRIARRIADMTERIYTRDQRGRLEPLEGERFAKEDELQALIAEHPELLDGTQMRPDAPRRWILIAREQGIAELSEAAARWAVDHLLVDQDAVPTLVEVKRGANPEIRRTIVGQMLEYAAHAARTWTADALRHAFEETTETRGLDPGEELRRLLVPDGEGEPDADGFWERVTTNLAAARLRLLFVADDIPDPLERVRGVPQRADGQNRSACRGGQAVQGRIEADPGAAGYRKKRGSTAPSVRP